jgi:hypothetical protein
MTHPIRAAADVPPNESCRGNCAGYGSRSSCPPLIVLAMHSERSASEQMLDRARYPHNPEMEPENNRLGHFTGALASGEFCACMFSHLASQSFTKSEM